MDLFAPFTGTLYLPDKELLNSRSPVLLPDGRPVAFIQWRIWVERFEVLDAAGGAVAECRAQGVFRRSYTVRTRDGRPIIQWKRGTWRPINGAELTLASGRRLAVRQVSIWSERRFEFYTPDGVVGRINPTTGIFTFHPDSYAFELLRPVLSALEAISLAQVLRIVVRGMRQQRASAGH